MSASLIIANLQEEGTFVYIDDELARANATRYVQGKWKGDLD